jgi:hypothetical protein
MREKLLGVHGNMTIIEWLNEYKVVSEYAKSNLACLENTLNGYKRIWRIRQKYFAAYGEYANRHKIEPISANYRPKPKTILIQNHLAEGAKNHLTLLSL